MPSAHWCVRCRKKSKQCEYLKFGENHFIGPLCPKCVQGQRLAAFQSCERERFATMNREAAKQFVGAAETVQKELF